MEGEDLKRLIEVEWGVPSEAGYTRGPFVQAYDRSGLLRDITAVLANEKINLTGEHIDRQARWFCTDEPDDGDCEHKSVEPRTHANRTIAQRGRSAAQGLTDCVFLRIMPTFIVPVGHGVVMS
jgi:hypothetical protein